MTTRPLLRAALLASVFLSAPAFVQAGPNAMPATATDGPSAAPMDESQAGEFKMTVDSIAQKPLTLDAVYGSPSLNGRAPMGLKLSPDGRLVTSLRPRKDEGNRMDLWAMDTETGEEYMLVDSKKVGSGARKAASKVRQFGNTKAGKVLKGTGHHHLLIDVEPVEAGATVAADEQHIHFGKGQTETEIELTPGEHTLRLQLADFAHRSYGPELGAAIKVTVE